MRQTSGQEPPLPRPAGGPERPGPGREGAGPDAADPGTAPGHDGPGRDGPGRDGPAGGPRRALVAGGGLAGLLAAAALAPYADRVTVVERDALPSGAEPRAFLPQAQHAHLLWSGGAEAIEGLLPGFTERLLAAGARRIPLTAGMVALSPRGWYRRWRPTHFLIACTRDLLDRVVRDQVLALPGVRLLERTQVLGLTGDRERITGLRVRTGDEAERTLTAALVVDATGRGSRTPGWLADLGIPDVAEALVDSGLVYASRMYRAPSGTEGFPVVNIQAAARGTRPGRSAVIVPVEDGRWLVTLAGTRGSRPSGDASAFEAFARSARHPVVADLLEHAEPLTGVVTFGNTANRRRYYERARAWPQGLVVIGDAVAGLNPVYGHGMSVAAQGARALARELGAGPAGRELAAPGLARRVQRAVARPVSVAWDLATGQDVFYPGSVGKRPTLADRLTSRYVERLILTATGDFRVATALTDVITLSAPATALIQPGVLLRALRGPRLPPLAGPPLTERELHFTRPTDAGVAETAGT
ncbi:FAD-dependent monooxygenase [Streptomyces sp. NPDC012888]|uniref:NAD(P)/FAD-dependent oxidoreductase n=1 Tax=Streptomyces sp. NPDC012888 TaxID=3364855 RepID=UPI0036A33E4D